MKPVLTLLGHRPWPVALILLALWLPACKEKKEDPDPTNKIEERTGLNGTDDVNTIPKTINRSSSLFGTTTLPAAVDLTKYLPPVGDQGKYGTCVAWAAAYNCKTALEAVKFGLTPTQLASTQYQLSPTDLFYNVEDAKKGAADCNGTDFVPALDVILNRGVATLAVAPYGTLGNCSKANADAAWNASAAKHKIERYRRVDFSIQAVKQELANNNPVVLGAKLADNFMTWNSDAVYQNWSSFDQVGIHSYHALCIVGYDNAKGPNGAFKIVNSWSPSWGAAGFMWVDYNFMMAGGTSGFCFNNNLFVAANDNQKPAPDNDPGPNPNPNPNPNYTGVDIVPWVFSDEPNPLGNENSRTMNYEIYNIGTQAARASTGWGWAYVYYNAFDANDYGVVFYNRLDPSTPLNATVFTCDNTGCRLNVELGPEDGIAAKLENNYSGDANLFQSYDMPTNVNGYYYLVMVADPANVLKEANTENNLFYVTDQDPTFFFNGVGGRRGAEGGSVFQNTLAKAAHKTQAAQRYQSAVNPKHRNAYSSQEIVGLLKDRVASGDFAAKVRAARASTETRAVVAHAK